MIDTQQLQALRQAVLAVSDQGQLGQVNALLVLAFRKIAQQDFTAAYLHLSFWPQLAPLVKQADRAVIGEQFEALVQA